MTLPPASAQTPHPTNEHISDEILRQVAQRGIDKSICPSEVAREVARALLRPDANHVTEWQTLMGPVRRAAISLARQGRIDILRKGKPVTPPEDPAALKGVIRLRQSHQV